MENIDWRKGNIIYDEFHIDMDVPLDQQIDFLTEDLMQIQYGKDYLLDIGWYPEFELDGMFVVQIIKYLNWEKPIYYIQCNEPKQIKNIVKEAIDFVSTFI